MLVLVLVVVVGLAFAKSPRMCRRLELVGMVNRGGGIYYTIFLKFFLLLSYRK